MVDRRSQDPEPSVLPHVAREGGKATNCATVIQKTMDGNGVMVSFRTGVCQLQKRKVGRGSRHRRRPLLGYCYADPRAQECVR